MNAEFPESVLTKRYEVSRKGQDRTREKQRRERQREREKGVRIHLPKHDEMMPAEVLHATQTLTPQHTHRHGKAEVTPPMSLGHSALPRVSKSFI